MNPLRQRGPVWTPITPKTGALFHADSHTFAYVRVSTYGQTTENQIGEIRAAGFEVNARRVVSETVSGSLAAREREGFAKLLDRMEEGDVLVVTKMDRLGRNSMDVRATVEHLAGMGVKVHCLALGGVDLTSSTGRMTMSVINAVAEFERDLLIERTQAGLIRAREQGKGPGAPGKADGRAEARGGGAPRWRSIGFSLGTRVQGRSADDPARAR